MEKARHELSIRFTFVSGTTRDLTFATDRTPEEFMDIVQTAIAEKGIITFYKNTLRELRINTRKIVSYELCTQPDLATLQDALD